MIQVRNSVFETNSSSTHSICISKNSSIIEIPKEITINLNDYHEFGWNFEIYNNLDDKLAYLIMAIFGCLDRDKHRKFTISETSKEFQKLIRYLHKLGIEDIDIKGDIYFSSESKNKNTHWYVGLDLNNSYIDHATECKEFVTNVLSDVEILKQYLFSKDSFIYTGCDQGDEREYETKDNYFKSLKYNYEVFYKGN